MAARVIGLSYRKATLINWLRVVLSPDSSAQDVSPIGTAAS